MEYTMRAKVVGFLIAVLLAMNYTPAYAGWQAGDTAHVRIRCAGRQVAESAVAASKESAETFFSTMMTYFATGDCHFIAPPSPPYPATLMEQIADYVTPGGVKVQSFRIKGIEGLDMEFFVFIRADMAPKRRADTIKTNRVDNPIVQF
jgi:hypothetical protein